MAKVLVRSVMAVLKSGNFFATFVKAAAKIRTDADLLGELLDMYDDTLQAPPDELLADLV